MKQKGYIRRVIGDSCRILNIYRYVCTYIDSGRGSNRCSVHRDLQQRQDHDHSHHLAQQGRQVRVRLQEQRARQEVVQVHLGDQLWDGTSRLAMQQVQAADRQKEVILQGQPVILKRHRVLDQLTIIRIARVAVVSHHELLNHVLAEAIRMKIAIHKVIEDQLRELMQDGMEIMMSLLCPVLHVNRSSLNK